LSLKDQSRSPGLLSTTALATVERAINTALRSDPASADRLALHAGRLLAIEVTLPPLAIYALIVEDGVELYHRSDANADVTVKGNPMDLAALLLNWNTRPGVIGGPVDISGNRELLQEMQQLARELQIDFVDANKDILIWQAISESPFREGDSPQEKSEKLQAVVDKIFSKYPPE